jgi:hypothetical protein
MKYKEIVDEFFVGKICAKHSLLLGRDPAVATRAPMHYSSLPDLM